jgi:phosphatidylglycerol:prolipoprotein diacylglycerol transferase
VYGLIISLAIFICILVIERLAKKTGKNYALVWEAAPIVILFGIVGARIYHVSHYLKFYLANPIRIIEIWNGGLGIIGAIIVGGIAVLIYLKFRKHEILPWLDIIAVALPLAQSIGRWANFFNQELFGIPTNLPWAVYIPFEKRPTQYLNFNSFHPVFLYESLLNLILFVFLYINFNNGKKPQGFFLRSYIIGYSLIRFALEFIKFNTWEIYGVNTAQIICAIMFVGTVTLKKTTKT